MTTMVWSPGWNTRIVLGPGQARGRAELERIARGAQHRSRHWHGTTVRALAAQLGLSVSRTWQLLQSLRARGVIALDPTRGRFGETRFTFGVRAWHVGPVRRGMLRRFTLAPGQLAFAHEDRPAAAPPPLPDPFSVGPVPDRPRVATRQSSDTHINPPAGWVAPKGTFAELMAKNGFDPRSFERSAEERTRWRR